MQAVIKNKRHFPQTAIDRATVELIEVLTNKRPMSFASKNAREIQYSLNEAIVEGFQCKSKKPEILKAFRVSVKSKDCFAETSTNTNGLLTKFERLAYHKPVKGAKS